MNVLFIGLGYMGLERLKIFRKLKKKFKINNFFFYDPFYKNKDKKLIKLNKLTPQIISDYNIDICVISTPHFLIKKYSILCLRSKRKVNLIIEKPYGRNLEESKEISKHLKKNQRIFIGLNYRFFQGISRMLKDIKHKKFGKIYSIDINFGHGHNPAIKKTWKLDKKLAGGGAILDPGIHVLNLIQLITKFDVKLINVYKKCNFWDTGVEDNAFIILSSKKIPLITIKLSTTMWRSTFQIQGNGSKGYWRINGRGRSYGPQTYVTGKRWGWLKGKKQKSTEQIHSDSNEKDVFLRETVEILQSIKKGGNKKRVCDDKEAIKTMMLLKKIYAF